MKGSSKSSATGLHTSPTGDGRVGLHALTHPIPAGMRDGLPGEARRLARVTRVVMRAFELFGYERVQLPALEYSEVLEIVGSNLDALSMLRFVEPETGEVVALRPDMTPQVARLVTTRLADAPMPARLCYQGSVLRRRRERARNNQQIPQAGIELLGVAGAEGDLEVLQAASSAVRASGLEHFIIDLGHSDIATRLMRSIPRERWPAILDALVLKDQAALERRAQAAGLRGAQLEALVALPELHGGGEVWTRAEAVLGSTDAAQPMRELKALWQAAAADGIADDVSVDLGETWRFDYYTGPMFQLLAEGPGLPVGSGGRYDALYARFGAAHPAAGCAIDLDNLVWACRFGQSAERAPLRVLVSGDPAQVQQALASLRAARLAAAPAPDSDAMVYARAWRYSHLVKLTQERALLTDMVEGSVSELGVDPESLCTALTAVRDQRRENSE